MKRKEIILNRYKTIGEEVEFLNMAIKTLEEQIEPGGALVHDTGDIHTSISQLKYLVEKLETEREPTPEK